MRADSPGSALVLVRAEKQSEAWGQKIELAGGLGGVSLQRERGRLAKLKACCGAGVQRPTRRRRRMAETRGRSPGSSRVQPRVSFSTVRDTRASGVGSAASERFVGVECCCRIEALGGLWSRNHHCVAGAIAAAALPLGPNPTG